MKVKKSYTKAEVLDALILGFEFEFYSSLDVFETARSIGNFTKKRVVVPLSMSSLGAPKPLYHSPVTPTSEIFKLEPDYSGGKKMCELVTGPMPYSDARNVLIKVFDWIRDNGYTNERCSIHVNISIDGGKIPTTFTIPNVNIAKFILSFDEDKIYSAFPKRKDSVYARSIKSIRPNRVLFYSPKLEDFSRATLTLPADEKYYGVNFLKAEKGYLEYRYLGGADYERKAKTILDIIDYFGLHLYDTLNFAGYTEKEKDAFRKIIDLDKKIYEGFVKYESFMKMFPDIKVTVDMNRDGQVLTALWGNIREKIYDLIVTGKMTKGEFNYDSEVGRFQLKDTKLKNCKLSEMEFINCELEGVINNSSFYSCTIKNSRIQECDLAQANTVYFSKVSECQLHVGNSCEDCFIENKRMIINCEVVRGVIRNGEIGKLAKISKETMIVEEPIETPGAYKDDKEDKKKKDDKK